MAKLSTFCCSVLDIYLVILFASTLCNAQVWTVINSTTTKPTTTTTTVGTTTPATPTPINVTVGPFDAFISYRRAPSRALAMLIKIKLAEKNINAFLDVEDLRGGPWNDQLVAAIANAPNFILVLSKKTLDRCIGDVNFTDIMHQEIREGVQLGKNVVPVFDEYDFPPLGQFSSVIQDAFKFQGVQWEHTLTQDSSDKLASYLNRPKKTRALDVGSDRKPHVVRI